MSVPKHIINDHGGAAQGDRVRVAQGRNVANVIGGGAGLQVDTTIVFGSPMPDANYGVVVTPNQDAVAFVTTKTTTGFTVSLRPRLAANTLAVGTFDWFAFE